MKREFNAKKYFEKNGYIYGTSEKYAFGRWTGYSVRFDDWDEAQEWLNTEEADFRERELMSKTACEKRERAWK